MAESADILTADAPAGDPARPRRRLLDGRHGRASPGRGGLGRARRRRASPDVTVPVTYMNSSADIKGFVGRNGGVVCTSSNAKRRWTGRSSAARRRCSSCPTSTSAATPRCCELGLALDDCVLYDPHKPGGGLTAGAAARRQDDPLARALLGARPVHAGSPCDDVRGPDPGRQRAGAPGVPARRGHRRRPRRARPSTSSGPSTRRRPARPGRSAPSSTWSAGWRRRTRTSSHVPGPDGLLLLDDEPDRPAAPGLGAGGAGRRAGGQPDHRAPDTARHARVALDRMLALP